MPEPGLLLWRLVLPELVRRLLLLRFQGACPRPPAALLWEEEQGGADAAAGAEAPGRRQNDWLLAGGWTPDQLPMAAGQPGGAGIVLPSRPLSSCPRTWLPA